MNTYRYFIQLSYFGKQYHGWQIQPNGNTVQEELNKALRILTQKDISVTGAGRTDTGVHANYFIAHFDTSIIINDSEKMVYRLNGILPSDIAVHKIFKVDNKYHARFDALSRTYKYFISKVKNPFRLDTHYLLYNKLDIELMNTAAKLLIEYNDFTSFSKLHTQTKTNNCIVLQACWEDRGDEIVFTVKADRFLRNMVRSIVGTLIEVGKYKLTIEELRQIIEKKNRCEAGVSVPAKGLYLWDIEYPKGILE